MTLYTETINKLFQTDITSYQIAKDLGLSPQYIDNYRTGRSKIENMRLGKAELLVGYYNGIIQEKYEEFKNMLENDIQRELPEFDTNALLAGADTQLVTDDDIIVFLSLEQVEIENATDSYWADLWNTKIYVTYIGAVGKDK